MIEFTTASDSTISAFDTIVAKGSASATYEFNYVPGGAARGTFSGNGVTATDGIVVFSGSFDSSVTARAESIAPTLQLQGTSSVSKMEVASPTSSSKVLPRTLLLRLQVPHTAVVFTPSPSATANKSSSPSTDPSLETFQTSLRGGFFLACFIRRQPYRACQHKQASAER